MPYTLRMGQDSRIFNDRLYLDSSVLRTPHLLCKFCSRTGMTYLPQTMHIPQQYCLRRSVWQALNSTPPVTQTNSKP